MGLEVWLSAWPDEGSGDGDLEEMGGMTVPGGGAPLTTWSSFEPDMVLFIYLILRFIAGVEAV